MCTGLAHSSLNCLHSTAPRWLHKLLQACCTVALTMLSTSPAIITIFAHNKPACVSVVLRWDNPTLHDSYLSTFHSPPQSPAANVKSQRNLPTRHTQNSRCPVMFQTLCTERKILMSPNCDKTSQQLHPLRQTCCNVLCSVLVKCSTSHKVCTWQSVPTENTKPASTLSSETYVLNMFIETATCFS